MRSRLPDSFSSPPLSPRDTEAAAAASASPSTEARTTEVASLRIKDANTPSSSTPRTFSAKFHFPSLKTIVATFHYYINRLFFKKEEAELLFLFEKSGFTKKESEEALEAARDRAEKKIGTFDSTIKAAKELQGENLLDYELIRLFFMRTVSANGNH